MRRRIQRHQPGGSVADLNASEHTSAESGRAGGTSWHLGFNTAASFVTNTNWQAYSGESALSYFSQMIGLGVQNFVTPAVGMAVLFALDPRLYPCEKRKVSETSIRM